MASACASNWRRTFSNSLSSSSARPRFDPAPAPAPATHPLRPLALSFRPLAPVAAAAAAATDPPEPVRLTLPSGLCPPTERSRSEDELRVDERPRDSDLESLEYEHEPVVVEPLTGEHPGERPRVGADASAGERKPRSGDALLPAEACAVAILGTGTGIAAPWLM